MPTRKRHAIWALVLSLVAGAASAESPRLLFDRSEIDALRQRIARPEFAPIWARILADAEAYCDPASDRYADPEDPYRFRDRQERMSQGRHDALCVHTVGRKLTDRMEAIGFAYQITGRRELGRHGAALLSASLERYPVTDPIVSRGFAGGRGDVMRGLAVGYDLLSDCLDDRQREVVAAACADYIDFFVKEFNDPDVWWYEVHNYNGVNGGAAGCLALALSDAYPERVDAWVAECVKIIERWLAAGFDEEGAYLEGVSYSGYGLANTVLFAAALARNGKGDLFRHPTFRKLPEFYALSLLPGESVYDARNDSPYAGMNISLLKLAEALDSGLYRWLWDRTGSDRSFLRIVWDNDVAAVDPAAAGVPRAKHFRGRGLCIWRTGWTDRDLMFSIEAGPYYPVTHNQADKGHFTLYGLGHRWATDPGYANEHKPNGRGQTVGHSCVLVDGKGQALSGAGWGTDGTIARFENNDRFGYALADCTAAYNRNNRGMPGAVVEHARRHALFIYPHRDAPAYAVVLDDVRKDAQPHEFTWQMMFPDVMEVTLGEGRAVFAPVSASGSAYVDTPADLLDGEARRPRRPGACVLDFAVDQPGQYVVWARVRTLAQARGKADSFFVRMDDGDKVAWHASAGRTWTWDKVSSGVDRAPVAYRLDAGKHRLAFEMREPGAQVDCLLITRHREMVPSLRGVSGNPLLLEAEAGEVESPMRLVRPPQPGTRTVVRVDAHRELALATDVFRPEDYHGRAAFPRFRATTQAVNPRFIAVLLPLPAKTKEPGVRFEAVPGKRIVRIEWPAHTDTIVWSESDGTATLVDAP